MSNTNPQIEKQLDKLASICCTRLENASTDPTLDDSSVEELLKSLLMSGYGRLADRKLQVDIESRVKDMCREPAMHRGGALTGITEQLQNKFDQLQDWESRQPDEKGEAKAANISSATDA
ncbi:hypothetical protein NZK35_24185 [Stieleria sp. ICT_E10.1]|uniref:hypothetical protein n=1 Tax=Stieleria sedimenti TaxID=2976331 RepID=UPI00217FD018|nr:hypothetical protein [Stieleria sedimenti]MCS7469763.1 hypothetical protein [Stieleria sedimenti]